MELAVHVLVVVALLLERPQQLLELLDEELLIAPAQAMTVELRSGLEDCIVPDALLGLHVLGGRRQVPPVVAVPRVIDGHLAKIINQYLKLIKTKRTPIN